MGWVDTTLKNFIDSVSILHLQLDWLTEWKLIQLFLGSPPHYLLTILFVSLNHFFRLSFSSRMQSNGKAKRTKSGCVLLGNTTRDSIRVKWWSLHSTSWSTESSIASILVIRKRCRKSEIKHSEKSLLISCLRDTKLSRSISLHHVMSRARSLSI